MKKIKILEVCYSLKAAGIETFVSNMQSYVNSNEFDIHYMVYKNALLDRFYRPNIESHHGIVEDASADECTNFLLRHILQRVNYCKILRREKFDIVHVHTSSGLQGIEVFLAHMIGVKNIVVHSHSSELSASSKFNGLKHKVHTWGVKQIDKYANQRIACSDKAALWLFKDIENVIIAKNGIVCKKYFFSMDTRMQVRSTLGIRQDEFVLGHIGAFSNIKNHKYIVDVFENLKIQIPYSKLIFIGTGKLEDEIKEYVIEKKIENDVKFLGTRNDCPKILMAMDCFVFPSLWEGLPISVIEAQASGLPCIISNTITDEVVITDLVKKEPIDLTSKSKWELDIFDIYNSRNDIIEKRSAYADAVEQSGFDMSYTTKEIEDIYRGFAYENNRSA